MTGTPTWLNPRWCLAAVPLVVAATGCNAPQTKPNLTSDRPSELVPALIDQASRGDDADYAALIRKLDNDDPAVRLFAARSLEELTGETFGYRYHHSRHDRRAAVDRWRAWLDERGVNDDTKRVSSEPSATAAAPQEPQP